MLILQHHFAMLDSDL